MIRRKAILLNSTISYLHLGCYLTSTGLRRLLFELSIDVIFECGVNQRNLNSVHNLLRSDKGILLIVNGEGTFHDNQYYSEYLLNFIQCVRNPKLLLNSQLKNFSKENVKKIKLFDFVQTRTKKDNVYAESVGIENVLCPDMLFYSGIMGAKELSVPNNDAVIFTDSHNPKSSSFLFEKYQHCSRRKKWVNFHYTPIGFDSSYIKFKSTISKFKVSIFPSLANCNDLNRLGYLTLSDLLSEFIKAEIIVTGRYHAACLAIALNKGLAYTCSNTSKVEDLCADFGYGCELTNDDVKPQRHHDKNFNIDFFLYSKYSELKKCLIDYLA